MSRKLKKARELGKQHGLEWATTQDPRKRLVATVNSPSAGIASKEASIRLVRSLPEPKEQALCTTLGLNQSNALGPALNAYEEAWHDAVLGFVQAGWIVSAQAYENSGRGVTCARSISDYLRLGDRASALAVWFNDGDKVQYPELYKLMVETLGCRLHATKACQEWLCSEKP